MKTALVGLALLTALGATPLHADERAEALRHYAKGKKAFELGAYDEAVAEYAATYRIKDDPALLYNLGQAHRLANHPAEALRSYRMFLIRVPDASNRDEVEQKIAELQKLVEQQKKSPNLPPESTRPLVSTTPATTTTAAVESRPMPIDANAGRGKMVAGGALAGAGLAVVVGGVVCGVLAKQNSDSLSKLDQTMQPFNSSQERAGKTEQILEGVFIGVGAAAIVTGGILVLVGHHDRRRARRLAVVPTVGRGQLGAAAQVTF